MRFITMGSADHPPVLFIHGLSATAESCYGEVGRYLQEEWHVILCELDGHYPGSETFPGIDQTCSQIEAYVQENCGRNLHGLVGLSLGGTIAVSILSRANILIQKTVLDAPFVVDMGILRGLYTWIFPVGVARIRDGKYVPGFLIDLLMGKGNRSVIEMLYPQITAETCRITCREIYRYHIDTGIRNTGSSVELWRGSKEPYPEKGAALLKTYLPDMKERVFSGMGHCQFLHEHPEEYARLLGGYMKEGVSQ